MRAMILAAGRGERMGELTAKTPKPLLKVQGRYLIEYSIDALIKAGVTQIVINVSYLREQIIEAIGNGDRYGIRIVYSEEEERLETGGGIVKALPWLGEEPFIVVSADVVTDYPLKNLWQVPLRQAHLVFVDNPYFNAQGDFCLNAENEVCVGIENRITFANVGIYHPNLFKSWPASYCRLADMWKMPIANHQITGEHYKGLWYNIGNPKELYAAEAIK